MEVLSRISDIRIFDRYIVSAKQKISNKYNNFNIYDIYTTCFKCHKYFHSKWDLKSIQFFSRYHFP